MENRDEARQTWETTRSLTDRTEYQRCRNAVKKELTRARREYLCGPLLNDRKNFWSRIRDFAIRPAQAESRTEDDIAGRADLFNEHFASAGARIAAEVTDQMLRFRWDLDRRV